MENWLRKNRTTMRLLCGLLPCFLVQPVVAEIVKIEVVGAIDPVQAEFIAGAVEHAADVKAEFLLIRLATPGGLGISMQEIVRAILNSEVPVVCYVAPSGSHAASAGFFILLAADVAAMAPATNTGAAHPVFPFGVEDEVLLEKVRNDALASLRSIVEQRKRNYELAEQGVTDSKSYTAQEALDGSLIDLIAQDQQDLLSQLEGREIERLHGEIRTLSVGGQTVETLGMTGRQRLLSAIASPNLALLLGVLGLLGLYLEFQAPGLVIPGVTGAICLVLSLLGFSLLPINYIGVLLLLLGGGLLVAEVLIQGFGFLGIGGALSMTLGLLFLIDSPYPELRIGWGMALAVALPVAVISLVFLWTLVKGLRSRVVTGREGLIGEIAVARSPVTDQGGRVFVHGELWNAVSDEPVENGQRVRIVQVEKLTLFVEPHG